MALSWLNHRRYMPITQEYNSLWAMGWGFVKASENKISGSPNKSYAHTSDLDFY